MIKLLVRTDAPDATSPDTRFGGLPALPRGQAFTWPNCACCDGPMQYLGRIAIDDQSGRAVLLFMCQNDPGVCEEWDADDGGNAAFVVAGGDLDVVPPPDTGETHQPGSHGAKLVEIDAADYNGACEAWASDTGRSALDVLGQMDGTPAWIQGDETPSCNCCNQPMQFLAQLEEGPDDGPAMNFGSGSAYVFVCSNGKPTAKFLWQC